MTTRRYVIVRVDSAPALDEDCWKTTSFDTARKNSDETKMVLSYESAPDCLSNVTPIADMSHDSAVELLTTDPDWYWD